MNNEKNKTTAVSPKIAGADFPVWHFPLNRPHAGIKLGNTETGLLVWGGGSKLHLSIGYNRMWDHDGGVEWREGQSYGAIRKALESGDEKALKTIFPPTPKSPQLCPLGRLVLSFGKGAFIDTAELDIEKALLKVNFRGGNLASFFVGVDWETGVVFAHFPKGAPRARVSFLDAYRQACNTETFKARGFKPPVVRDNGFEQAMPHDPAVGFALAETAHGVFAAHARAGEGKAFAAAEAIAKAAAKSGARALMARTARRWGAFWKDVPRVSVPNATLQNVFDYGMYQFGAATDSARLSTVAPLQGPWYADDVFPPWGGDYHFNINLQEYYWPAFHGNRLEHLRPVFDMLKSWMPRLRHNARVFVGIDDGVMLPHAVDDTGKVMTAGFWTGMMDHGSTMWMADMMWRYYEFGGAGGKKFLRDDAMPFMKGAFNVFWKMLDRAADGALSLPVGSSPEYRGAAMDAWGRNASFQLACAHRLARNLLSAAVELGEKADPRWGELTQKLPLASVVESANGYGRQIGLWEGLTLELSHRHHSHLAGVFPFDTIDIADPEWHGVVAESIGTWLHHGTAYWSGWCVPWASIISTRVGNAEAAEFLLEFWERFFVNEGRGTLHDSNAGGFNLMGQPPLAEDFVRGRDIIQFDAAGGATEAIYEMLCHERQGVTYLFRGAPKRWLDVSFAGVRTTGGVLVSAARREGVVGKVSLAAAAGAATLRLANPWPGHAAKLVADGKTQILPAGGEFSIKLRKGGKAILRRV